jgi:hypothetical protein
MFINFFFISLFLASLLTGCYHDTPNYQRHYNDIKIKESNTINSSIILP